MSEWAPLTDFQKIRPQGIKKAMRLADKKRSALKFKEQLKKRRRK